MESMQLAMEILDRAQERFEETFEQMTTEEANKMPAPLIKSVTWLMWHTARESADFSFKWDRGALDECWLDRKICIGFTG